MNTENFCARPLDSWSVIRIGGNDRVTFLQGQLTQDVSAVCSQRPMLAGWANNKGRLLCTCWLVDWQDALWLVLPRERRDEIARRLQMFVLRAAVEIGTPDVQVWLLNKTDKHSHNDSRTFCFYNDFYYAFGVTSDAATGLALGAWPLPAPQPATPGLLPADTAWRRTLIQTGIPAIYNATAERFVPQMVNLDLLDAISFDKGCYVGQEIVARTHNLGRIKRRMFAFDCPTKHPSAEAGSEIFSGTENAGTLVDAIVVDGEQQLLGVIRLDCSAADLRLAAPDGPILSRTAMPYQIPEAVN